MARQGLEEDSAYCADQVRLGDKDRYLSALYAPDVSRRSLLALYAFHLEITKIPELVSEPQLGEIRYAWWHDAINDLFAGTTSDHPIIREMSDALADNALDKTALLKLIDASRNDLYPQPMRDMRDFEQYGHDTFGALYFLASKILTPLHAGAALAPACHAGLATALITCISRIASDASRGKVHIPMDVLARHGLAPADIITGEYTPQVREMFVDICQWADASLERFKDNQDQVPKGAAAAFLPVSVLDLSLNRMREKYYNPMHQIPRVSPLRRQWRLWRCARRGVI